MKLDEVLKKQKERRFKNPMVATSNTLSIQDYLSDPHASRPYINEVSATKNLSMLKNKNEDLRLVEVTPKAKIVETEKSINNLIALTTQSIENTTVRQSGISDTIETQELDKATQKLNAANKKATQQFLSATQSTTQKSVKNKPHVGRPRIISFDYFSLVGNELNITNEIYAQCLKSKSLETNFIEKNEFSQIVNVKSGAIRTSCTRLRAKGVLDDFIATKGRGSAWKFVLSENIHHQISLNNNLKTTLIRDTNGDTKILSSNSSINNYKATTTQLPSDWKKIEYTELQKTLNIFCERFGLAQIKTVFAEAGHLISAEDVQISIYNFTMGLNNYIQKPSSGIYDRKVKIATLLESLKNGELFIDPQVEAAKEAEEKRIIAEQRKKMAFDFFEPKFEYFFKSLSDDQAIALIPETWRRSNKAWEHAVKTSNIIVQKSYAKDFAKEYFKNKIWPDILDTLLK